MLFADAEDNGTDNNNTILIDKRFLKNVFLSINDNGLFLVGFLIALKITAFFRLLQRSYADIIESFAGLHGLILHSLHPRP